jgi:uroporphyrinogen decarboxylase
MTSRERIIKVLKHETTDRIPLDLGGTESSGITGIAYNNLRKHLDLGPGETRIFDVYQQITKIEGDIRDILELDTVPLLLEPVKWKPFKLADGSACQIPEKWNPEKEEDGGLVVRNSSGTVIARMPEGGFYFDPAFAPLAGAEKPSDLNSFKEDICFFDWPSFADESLESVAARAQKLFQETSFAIVANLQLHLLAAGQILRGFETFMMDLLINKELAHALLEMLTHAYIERCEKYFSKVGSTVQVVLVNDDLGIQSGPMIPVDCYKEMVWPYQKRLFEFIKKKSGAFLLFHSCGSVHQFIPLFIEAGVDALNPVQVSAEGMDTKRLGGCDTQRILSRGTKDQIKDEVRRRMGDLAGEGGFVFTQVHNIQPDVPPENIMAMVKAFQEFR